MPAPPLNLASGPNALLTLISPSSSVTSCGQDPRACLFMASSLRFTLRIFSWLPKIASFPPTSTTVHALFHTTSFSKLRQRSLSALLSLCCLLGGMGWGRGAGSLSCLHPEDCDFHLTCLQPSLGSPPAVHLVQVTYTECPFPPF